MRNLVFILMLMLTSCKIGENYKRPEIILPDSWPNQNLKKLESQNISWWKNFNDPNLNKLIEEGLNNNNDLLIATYRIDEARAILSLTESNYFPNINTKANFTRNKNSQETLLTNAQVKPQNIFNLSAVLSYELDLWGKLRWSTEADKARLLATEENRNVVLLAITSEITNAYFNLLMLNEQILTTNKTINSLEKAFLYLKNQSKSGMLDELLANQAEVEYRKAKTLLLSLEQNYYQQLTALKLLLGNTPKELTEQNIEITTSIDKIEIPKINLEQPISIINTRPDIRAAEQLLIASNADVNKARTLFLPTISLSGLIGMASNDIDKLLNASSKNWQLASNLSMPIIDFGRTSNNIKLSKSAKDQALVNYQQIINKSFKEILDLVNSIEITDKKLNEQTLRVKALKESLRINSLRYNNGYINLLKVIKAEIDLSHARIDYITSKRDKLSTIVNLYKALGK